MNDMLKVAMLKWINGKGIAFVCFAYAQATAIMVLAYVRPETPWATFATALAAVNGPFYAAGAWKAQSDARAGAAK